jgi:hypothetical protein
MVKGRRLETMSNLDMADLLSESEDAPESDEGILY